MSWQGYVDTNLLATGRVSKAAILGLKGGVWAKSSGFELSAEEQKTVINAWADKDKTQSQGLRLAGEKYFTLSIGERNVYGKKAADGCVLVKTKQAVLVAVYQSPIQAAECTVVVEGLADYLISVGY